MQIIDDAIDQRRLLTFLYRGKRRVVAPHIHGLNRRGAGALSGVQVAGESNSGELGWKTFLIEEIQTPPALGDRFSGPDPDYNPNDPGFSRIFSKL